MLTCCLQLDLRFTTCTRVCVEMKTTRNVGVTYSKPPGRCASEMGSFTVNYTLNTGWTYPAVQYIVRHVSVLFCCVALCCVERTTVGDKEEAVFEAGA